MLMYCVLHKFNALYDGNWVRYYYYVRIEKMNWFSWTNDVDHEGFNGGNYKRLGGLLFENCRLWQFLGVHGFKFLQFWLKIEIIS